MIIKKDSPIQFTIKDKSQLPPATIDADYEKSALPITAEQGLLNVIQEFTDSSTLTSEHGNYKSPYIDYSLYTANEITQFGESVLTSRIATGYEGYKCIDIFYEVNDDNNIDLRYKLPRFKNAKPTSSYIKNENVFSDTVDDYKVDTISDTEDILSSDDWSNTNDLMFMFTIQSFKPTNFNSFNISIDRLSFGDIDDIEEDNNNLTREQIRSNFIKISIVNLSGSIIEEFICSLNNTLENTDYFIIDQINMNSNYIFITKIRNDLSAVNISELNNNLNLIFNSYSKIYNRNFITIDSSTSTILNKSQGIDFINNSMEVLYNDNSGVEHSIFQDEVDETNSNIFSKYPTDINSVEIGTSSNVSIDSTNFRIITYNEKNYIYRNSRNIFKSDISTSFTVDSLSNDFSNIDDTTDDIDFYFNDTDYVTLTSTQYSITSGTMTINDLSSFSNDNLDKHLSYDFKIVSSGVTYKNCYINEMVKPDDDITSSSSLYLYDGSLYDPTSDVKSINSISNVNPYISIETNEIVLGDTSSFNIIDYLNVNYTSDINIPSTFNITINTGDDGSYYKFFEEIDLDISNIYNISLGLNETIDFCKSSSNESVFLNNSRIVNETNYFNYNILTNDFVYGDGDYSSKLTLNNVYDVDNNGYIEINNFQFDFIIDNDTLSSSIDVFNTKKYNDEDSDVTINSYKTEDLKSIYENGALETSLFKLLFEDKNVEFLTILDPIVKDDSIEEKVQSQIVSLVNTRKNIFGELFTKRYNINDISNVNDLYENQGLIDPNNDITYSYHDNYLIEVLDGWTLEKLNDNSEIYVPKLGGEIAKRMSDFKDSPVLGLGGVRQGKNLTYRPLVTTPEDKLYLFKKLRVNSPFRVRNYGTYIFNDFTTYRKNSDLNKVENIFVLLYLMNEFYPILMKYIKKPISTLTETVNNVQNIKNELYSVITNVRSAFSKEAIVSLISTSDELDRGYLKFKVALYFADDIEAIEVVFEVNNVGELYFDILNQ